MNDVIFVCLGNCPCQINNHSEGIRMNGGRDLERTNQFNLHERNAHSCITAFVVFSCWSLETKHKKSKYKSYVVISTYALLAWWIVGTSYKPQLWPTIERVFRFSERESLVHWSNKWISTSLASVQNERHRKIHPNRSKVIISSYDR